MTVFVIDSEMEDFKSFIAKLASMVELSHVKNFTQCLGDVSEGDIIVNVMDGNEEFDKATLQFRKFNIDLKVIGFYKNITEDEIIKHSQGKAGADVYFSTEVGEDDLAENLKELGITPQFFSEETKTLALGIVRDHILEKSLTENAKEISDRLDQVFAAALPEDYKIIKKEKKKNKKSESVEELSIGSEVSMSDEIDLDISGDEIELGDSEDNTVQEINPNEVALDTENNSLDIELGASDEVISSDPVNPDEIDLSADEIAPIEEVEEAISEEVQSPDDIDMIEELSFGEEDSVTTEEETPSSEDEVSNDDEIQLFDDDSPSQVLNLGEATGIEDMNLNQTETESVLDEIEFGIDSSEGNVEQEIEVQNEMTDEPSIEEGFDLSEIDLSEATDTIQGVKMTSSEDLISSGDDDPLDDIKTKMMEIDKLLLSDDDDEGDEEISVPDELSMVSDDENLNDAITQIKESIGQQNDEVIPIENVQENLVQPEFVASEVKEYQRNYDDELIRLGETINSLRKDRESLLDRVQTLEDTHDSEKRDFLSLKAELDEKKIEIAIIKKRYGKQIEDLNIKLDLVENKKDILVEQNKNYQHEFDKLRVNNKTDLSKVRYREQELEQKLELLRNDAEVQIQNRDHKILELKRRIDTLEFDIENSQIKERKSIDDQGQLEDKMHNVIKTLRNAIGDLEGDTPASIRERLIKKNLDV